jgi:hypothetical protein
MYQNAFVRLEADETKELLGNVEKHLEGGTFTPENATILAQDFSFYPGYRFLDIANFENVPAQHRYVLYKSDDIIVLDWTNEPIYALNDRLPITLDDNNITDYIRFFFSYVRGKQGRFVIVENVDDINWREEPPASARKAIGNMLEPISIFTKDKDGGYHMEACLVFQDSLFKSKIEVKTNGLVNLYDEELIVEDMPIADQTLGL